MSVKKLLILFIIFDIILIAGGTIFYVIDGKSKKTDTEEINKLCDTKVSSYKYVCTSDSDDMEGSFKSILKEEIETDEFYSITSINKYTIYTLDDKEAYTSQKETLIETENYIPSFDDKTQTVTLKIKVSNEYIGMWYKEYEKDLIKQGYSCSLVTENN